MDPTAYQAYRRSFEAACTVCAPFRSFRVSNRGCFHALSLLVNAEVSPYRDSSHLKNGWAAMACFGDFEGGELCFPELKCKIPFLPGDVVLFRSAVLEHWVAPFEGTRYSCLFFTQQSSWDPLI